MSQSEAGVEVEQQQPSSNNAGSNDLSLEELLYSSSSFHAIAVPVTITMILSSLVVRYVNTEETIRETQQALSVYEAFDTDDAGTAKTLGLSLLNGLIMVSVIGGMTFGIVLLYKYRCMKCLMGYLMFSSAMLLGFLGGVILYVAIDKYELNIDAFSFYFFLYNFAIVGVTAIFWQKGIPRYISQGYLVMTSVILAWQLSHFDDWTAWTLLFMLALYDLCAVLTPCGPLKFLVQLMQRDDAPDMPGLLYEAQLPSEARRPGTRPTGNTSCSEGAEPPSASSTDEPVAVEEEVAVPPQGVEPNASPITGNVPLAIAKLYRLPLTEPIQPTDSFTPLLEEGAGSTQIATNDTLAQQYSPEQLCTQVEATFPTGGGRIEPVVGADGETRYFVKDRHGAVRRILVLDDAGRVMEVQQNSRDDDDDKDNSIKLGLGDFIFYSLLTSKAAQYNFVTFAACALVILAGLGGTLVLLAVYRHALPALPISIILGVIFFLLTSIFVLPWIEIMFQSPLYV
eukprot:CAMPEP_0194134546 /NCGR_PEP_ID=MMETSP0152-20130528/4618_1 /TAXON_ID=1049557 /ORGANISM="Thalassiothrix antarctica, Strain L6-D1" /LENGTH=510 /DNA_ID=CAMNT_0038830335 /DNA_START=118 /DNA_END=1650 /DNA_ORIENTATION=-